MTPIRRRRARFLLALALLLAGAAGGLQAATLRIRMIRGSHEEGQTPPALADIADMMRNTLAFKTYALDAEARMPLPADGRVVKLRVYDVTCTGPAERLKVSIVRRDKRVLDTVASVRPGHPVILGGFPARRGEGVRMFVLTIAADDKN